MVFLFSGFCITVTCPLVSKIAYSTSPRLYMLFPLNLSSNSLIVNLSFFKAFSSIFPLYINIVGFPHIISLAFILFTLRNDITRCISNNPKIDIIPLVIGIPESVIGIDAKSAIIIAIASSNGCNCPISLFPINLITINTNM